MPDTVTEKPTTVCLPRTSAEALIRLIDDRWTPAETVLKRVKESLRAAIGHADYEAAEALYGDNRCEHGNWTGGGYGCPDCRQAAWQRNPWAADAQLDGSRDG